MKGPILGLSCVVAGAVALLAVSSVTGLASAATAVPYTDPAVAGSIGLCNQAGQQVTSGSVDTVPFAWRAVSTQPASAPYNNAGTLTPEHHEANPDLGQDAVDSLFD